MSRNSTVAPSLEKTIARSHGGYRLARRIERIGLGRPAGFYVKIDRCDKFEQIPAPKGVSSVRNISVVAHPEATHHVEKVVGG